MNTPVAAAEACNTWTVEMQEDEGGPVLTASACATDRPDAYLALTCSRGRVYLRYDLAAGAERSPDLEEVADVDFTVGVSTQRLSMRYEEMDARHAADVPASGPLVSLLKTGESVGISDAAGRYPQHAFSLVGSSSAIANLIAQCR
ncbi:hypothetical protein [Devosia sp.]|uniref:hypothetical protein n=1 Tax=Devosia sp. TaxID=1871048 RepID=UPI0026020D7F|nr:hypothetical protein [Devosia sp.]